MKNYIFKFLVNFFFITLSIIFFLNIIYKDFYINQSTLKIYYEKYYIVSFFLFLFSFLYYFFSFQKKINSILIFFSFIFSLYIIELFLILNYNYNYLNKATSQQDKKNLFIHLKLTDSDLVTNFTPRIYNSGKNFYYYFSGISNKKTLFCNENGYFSFYNSDRYGFNNPDQEWDKEIIEFFLLGDSFTKGACVNEVDSIASNLRKFLKNNKNIGVLNLASEASGPLSYYSVLKEYLDTTKNVQNVLWFHYEGNDMENLSDELKNSYLIKYLDNNSFTQGIKEREIIKKIEANQIKIIDHLILEKRNNFITFLKFDKFRWVLNNFFIPDYKKFSEIIYKTNIYLKNHNINFYFIYLPSYANYTRGINLENKDSEIILEIVSNYGIPIINLKEAFAQHEDPLSFFPSRKFGHYNELGYKFVSDYAYKEIQRLKMKRNAN